MTDKDRKREAPLHLDMDFGEALERFARTDPKEARDLMDRGKKQKPPEDKPPAAKGDKSVG